MSTNEFISICIDMIKHIQNGKSLDVEMAWFNRDDDIFKAIFTSDNGRKCYHCFFDYNNDYSISISIYNFYSFKELDIEGYTF